MLGLILGVLAELYPDRIVIGSWTVHLRDGATCPYEIGKRVEVVYTERRWRGSRS